jgi:hypothetical protein
MPSQLEGIVNGLGGLTPSRSPKKKLSNFLAEVSGGIRWGGKGLRIARTSISNLKFQIQ